VPPFAAGPLLDPSLAATVHLRAVMADVDEHVWRGRLARRGLRGPAAWERHVAATRRRFRESLGPLPQRTPLRVERSRVLERDGYTVETLLVETQPDFFVPANLYLPARRPAPAPGVLNAVGHWQHSKAQDVEQARCAGLARKGYVALIWDPLGQGERFQYRDAAGALWAGAATEQHAAVCDPAFLIGSTVIATMLWDGVRLLDYLAARPEVDAGRLGCTGVSGGGTYTMFLGAFDDRLKATVPVCSTSTLERMHRQGQIGEPCQAPWRSYPDGLDTADLLLAHAPAALRIIGTSRDFFPLAGLRDAALQVQDGYAALGYPGRSDLCVVDAGHDYNREQRELMYAWFGRWLGNDAPVAEDPFEPEDPATLWCTASGQLLTDGRGRTAPDLVRALAARLIPAPAAVETAAAAGAERERVRAAARRRLGPIPAPDGAPPRALPGGAVDGVPVERLVLQARMDVPLPALLFRPPGPVAGGRAPAVVLLDDRGKDAAAGPHGLAPGLARAGVLALSVDLRGWGETAWVEQRFGWRQDRRAPLGADNMLAYVGYLTGTASVAQRVQDVGGVLRYLRARPDVDPARLYLAGRGGGAVVALHAAAVDAAAADAAAEDAAGGAAPGLRGVLLDAGLATYRAAVEAPRCLQPVADFLPGALLEYDLPDLAAALAPAAVLVLDPQDGAGAALPEAEAVATFQRAATLAARLGGSVRVRSGLPPDARSDAVASWIAAG
jgi:dienelactone hydrolase